MGCQTTLFAIFVALVVLRPGSCDVFNVDAGATIHDNTSWAGQNGLPLLVSLQGPVTLAGGATLTIRDAALSYHVRMEVNGNASSVGFGDLLALPALFGDLPDGAQLRLERVHVYVTCDTLQLMDGLSCSNSDIRAVRAQLGEHGRIWVPAWSSPQLTATDVEISCRPAPTTESQLSGQPAAPWSARATTNATLVKNTCAAQLVMGWKDIVVGSTRLQHAAATVHLFLGQSITVPYDYTAVQNGTIYLSSHLRIAASPILDYLPQLMLGYLRGTYIWEVTTTATLVVLEGLLMATLPLGPNDKFPYSTLGWGIWAVKFDRCTERPPEVYVVNCTLVVSTETMDYNSFWAGEYLSPFPDRRLKAEWYGVDYTCDPPRNRSLLYAQVDFLSQFNWFARSATTLAVGLINTFITDKHPDVQAAATDLQLTKLFEDPYTPFTTVKWVSTPLDFIAALTSNLPNIVVVYNISIPPSAWPKGGPLRMSQPLTIAGWPARKTVIDWQGVAGVIELGPSKVTLRNLWTVNGGHMGVATRPGYAQNLTFYQWPFTPAPNMQGVYDRGEADLQFTNVTLVIPDSEYAIIFGPNVSSGASRIGGSTWAQTAINLGQASRVGVLVEEGLLGFTVTLVPASLGASLLPYSVMNTHVEVHVTDSDTSTQPGAGGGADETWKVVLGVVLPLGCVLLAGGVFVVLWWRRQGRERAVEIHKLHEGEQGWDDAGAATPRAGGTHDADGHTAHSQERVSTKSGASAGAVPGGRLPYMLQQSNPGGAGPPHVHTSQRGGSSSSDMSSSNGLRAAPTLGNSLHASRPAMNGGAADDSQATPTASSSHSSAPHPGLSRLGPSSSDAQRTGSGRPTPQVGQHDRGAQGVNSSVSTLYSISTTSSSTPAYGRGMMGNGQERGGTKGGNSCGAAGEGGRASGDGHIALRPGSHTEWDSFDCVPEHHEQLLINRMDVSHELAASLAAPSVAEQLKEMVARMQMELGDQEVEVMRAIGQGASGVVYQGTWRGLTVAVKTLVFTVLPHQPMSRRQHRAMTEAAICRTLQHPNIVATYAYDLHALHPLRAGARSEKDSPSTSSGPPGANTTQLGAAGPDPPTIGHQAVSTPTEFKLYIIQEYCDGGTLRAAIDDGKLHDISTGSPRPVMRYIVQLATDIAAGMAHVHSRNVVHGDLTPANVLLRCSGTSESSYTAKIADFGLSWKLSTGQQHVSNARQGTGFYISPEVLHVGIMSKAADVFSFGMVLHEMYHGTPFWRRTGPTGIDKATVAAAAKRPGAETLAWDPYVPAHFRDLVVSCLDSDPQARPTFFKVVESLLAMQRQLHTATQATESAAMGAAVHAIGGPSGHVGSVLRMASRRKDASRAPTSGLLEERDIKALMHSMRMSWSSNGAVGPVPDLSPPPGVALAPELAASEMDGLVKVLDGGPEVRERRGAATGGARAGGAVLRQCSAPQAHAQGAEVGPDARKVPAIGGSQAGAVVGGCGVWCEEDDQGEEEGGGLDVSALGTLLDLRPGVLAQALGSRGLHTGTGAAASGAQTEPVNAGAGGPVGVWDVRGR